MHLARNDSSRPYAYEQPGGHRNGNGTAIAAPSKPAASLPGRHPPTNLDAEMGAIGSMLLSNDAIADLVLLLKPTDFFRDAHQILCRAIFDLYAEGTPVDVVTLADELVRRQELRKVGGDDYIAQILDSTPHAVNALYYAGIIRQKAISRQLIDAANATLNDAYADNSTGEEQLAAAEKAIFAIADKQAQGDVSLVGDLIDDTLERLDRRQGGEVIGIPTGLNDLDDVTCGFQPGNVIYLAGRTSMGKTSLALNIAEHIGINLKIPTLYVSLEMSKDELMDRLVCSRAGIDGQKLKTGGLNPDERQRARATREAIKAAPLFLDDTPTRNMLQVSALARRLKMRHGLGALFFDYIQLCEPEDHRDPRHIQVAKVSRRLKILARELGIPVLVLSQLNRGPEGREDHRPRMSDLRESGDQEQDADAVILLHRPDYYDPNDKPGIATAIVAKNRNGRRADVDLLFRDRFMRFDNLDKHHAKDEPPIEAFGAAPPTNNHPAYIPADCF